MSDIQAKTLEEILKGKGYSDDEAKKWINSHQYLGFDQMKQAAQAERAVG